MSTIHYPAISIKAHLHPMSQEPEEKEPFVFWLVRQFLEPDEDQSSEEQLSNKDLYSMFALIVVVLATLALTVGPFSLLK